MPRYDPLPPPIASISAPVSVIDRQALRASLRLVLTASDADEVAARLPAGGDLVDLGTVARDAVGRARLDRLLARLPWRRDGGDGRLLGPATGAPSEAAVALALEVGLGLDGRDLADVLDTRVERVGEWLVAGRRAIDPEMPDPCRKTAFLVGRYDDRSLDPDERIELITHLNRCATCQTAVERSREVDAAIRAEVERQRALVSGQAVSGVSRLERTRRGALLAGLLLVLTIALVAGATAISRLVGEQNQPAPLVVGESTEGYAGWIVMAREDGAVVARNLRSGETRQIIDSRGGAMFGQQVQLSPGGTRLLSFSGEYSQNARGRMVMSGLDGSVVGEIEWADQGMMHVPSGWIDEQTILMSVFPLSHPDETTEQLRERYAAESRLLAVNVASGNEREILRGNVSFGIPSPNGRFVVAARPTGPYPMLDGTDTYSIEIWPLDGAAARPVTTIDDWKPISSGFTWAGDGSALFTTRAAETEGSEATPETERRTTPNSPSHELIAIGLDGTVTVLAEAGGDTAIYPISAAPDGSSVVVFRVEGSNVLPATSYWLVSSDGGEPRQLSGAIPESFGGQGVVWSPDGSAILLSEVSVPYLEPDEEDWTRWGATGTEMIAVGVEGNRTTLLSSFSVGDFLLGWLPEDAIPSLESDDEDVRITAPDPVPDVPDDTQLGATSAASRDGAYVTLDDLSIGSPLVWKVGTNDTQRLRGSLDDAIWLPGTTGVLTVSGGRSGSRSSSQLSVLASTNPYAPMAFEPKEFDPAGLDGDPSRHYAAPRVSGDGLNTSFFVVGEGGVELWLANAAGIERVTGWNLPGERIIEPQLAARWVDDRTLVFVEPRDWTRGMPQTARLRRLVVEPDGSATVEDVIELVGRGDDRGIAVQEIAISADGSEIAWRTRHYTELAADDGRFDTIHLAPVDDLTRDVELTRGSPGSGLAWSPTRRLLLAGIDQEVALIDAADLRIQVVSGDQTADNPIWVGGDEVWFAAGEDGVVMRVRVE